MLSRCVIALASVAATLWSQHADAALFAYFYDRLGPPITTGRMYKVDLHTGQIADQGAFADQSVFAMGFDATGSRLIALGGRENGNVWDYSTKPGTFIGNRGPSRGIDGGLQFNRANNKWYALQSADSNPSQFLSSWLYELNITTGQYTQVGSRDDHGYCSGFAISPDGRAFGIDCIFENRLYSIDLTTGVKTTVATVSGLAPDLYSMCFDATGKLWVVRGGTAFSRGSIHTLDTTTGVATNVADLSETGHQAYGLAIVIPEPGTLLVLVGAGVSRRRRRS